MSHDAGTLFFPGLLPVAGGVFKLTVVQKNKRVGRRGWAGRRCGGCLSGSTAPWQTGAAPCHVCGLEPWYSLCSPSVLVLSKAFAQFCAITRTGDSYCCSPARSGSGFKVSSYGYNGFPLHASHSQAGSKIATTTVVLMLFLHQRKSFVWQKIPIRSGLSRQLHSVKTEASVMTHPDGFLMLSGSYTSPSAQMASGTNGWIWIRASPAKKRDSEGVGTKLFLATC
jgi:hypothetical protein